MDTSKESNNIDPRILTWNLQIGQNGTTWNLQDQIKPLVESHDIICLQEVTEELRTSLYKEYNHKDSVFLVRPQKNPTTSGFLPITLIRKSFYKMGIAKDAYIYKGSGYKYAHYILAKRDTQTEPDCILNLHLKKDDSNTPKAPKRTEQIKFLIDFTDSRKVESDPYLIDNLLIAGDFNCDEKEVDNLVNHFKQAGHFQLRRHLNPFASFMWFDNNKKPQYAEKDYILSSTGRSNREAFTRFNEPTPDFVEAGVHFPVSTTKPSTINIKNLAPKGSYSATFRSDGKKMDILPSGVAQSANSHASLQIPKSPKKIQYCVNSGGTTPSLKTGFLYPMSSRPNEKFKGKNYCVLGDWSHA